MSNSIGFVINVTIERPISCCFKLNFLNRNLFVKITHSATHLFCCNKVLMQMSIAPTPNNVESNHELVHKVTHKFVRHVEYCYRIVPFSCVRLLAFFYNFCNSEAVIFA